MSAEDEMARQWSDLSDRSRRLIIAAAIGEAILKTAVLIDIRRRPASQIRGSKRMWIFVAVLLNSAGIGSLSYFAFGRRWRAEGRAGHVQGT
jgi:Phospholipase_D-nuclease N-terminal